MTTVIRKKAEAAREVVAEREGAFQDERDAEADLCAEIVQDVLPVLPMLCSRVIWDGNQIRGLEVAPSVYLDERGRFWIVDPHETTLVEPRDLPAKYGRGSARLLAFCVGRALDALVAGGSHARADEARKLAEKYKAVSTLIRGGAP